MEGRGIFFFFWGGGTLRFNADMCLCGDQTIPATKEVFCIRIRCAAILLLFVSVIVEARSWGKQHQ